MWLSRAASAAVVMVEANEAIYYHQSPFFLIGIIITVIIPFSRDESTAIDVLRERVSRSLRVSLHVIHYTCDEARPALSVGTDQL